MTPTLEWFKSSYSGNEDGDCIEVAISPAAPTHPTVHVRDSKDREGGRLIFTTATWTDFLAHTRHSA
ncbi:DUF397 domain-containing protein [Streptomyces lanatus]|uniref:DUF397 domain-containing protein n=1 Tax=Streptomyces lanatus TaxID=66900 RepID=A0ABV1XSJ9_9ACTN|nr:DUF397 domain-containing protein [Streptomyces lanatus]GHH07311.1 hypothetical protein GCM10018780_41030 [Streptomyces lanatus]